jgi:hypothetical protein
MNWGTPGEVVIVDPSLDSDNEGDRVLVEAALRELGQLRHAPRLPSHRWLSRAQAATARQARVCLVVGTNILSSHLEVPRQWKLGPVELWAYRKKLVLLGVGWWQYQPGPCRLTRSILTRILHPDAVHSVRDDYTKDRLAALGYRVANTCCPSTWPLADTVAAPASGRTAVVSTVSDYSMSAFDLAMLTELADRYAEVLVWPQGRGDLRYLASLDLPRRVVPLPPGLASFDSALRDADYVGTRLHGGIRAHQLGAPALVVAIDNRAVEMSADTGLPIVRRGDIDGLRSALDNGGSRTVSWPRTEQARWRTSWLATIGEIDGQRRG